jgi:hypothetical protein
VELARQFDMPAYFYVVLLVAPDGSVRDVEPLVAYPSGALKRPQFRYAFGLHFDPIDGHEAEAARSTAYAVTQGSGPNANARAGRAGQKALADVASSFVPCARDESPLCQFMIYTLAVADTQDLFQQPLLLRAAQGGYAPAQQLLGRKLAFGSRREPDKARRWLDLAIANGDNNAAVTLARLEVTSVPANWTRAAELLERVAATHHRRASLALAALRIACPDPALRRDSVENLLKQTIAFYGEEPIVLEVQAAQAAAKGDFKQAVARERRAIGEARELQWNVALLEERLAAYEQKERWFGDLLGF